MIKQRDIALVVIAAFVGAVTMGAWSTSCARTRAPMRCAMKRWVSGRIM